MSAASSDDAAKGVSNQGPFHARKPPAHEEIPETKHKPGLKVSEKDRAPEHHPPETLPPGSAPKENTFKPNPVNEFPPVVDYSDDIDPDAEAEREAARDLPGATSADVDRGLGHPMYGETSKERHHDGMQKRKKQDVGIAGRGGEAGNSVKQVDPHNPYFADQRGLDREEAQGRVRGAEGVHEEEHQPRPNAGGDPAEDKVPESAETVAAEAPKK